VGWERGARNICITERIYCELIFLNRLKSGMPKEKKAVTPPTLKFKININLLSTK
jgi:hypothetical protein